MHFLVFYLYLKMQLFVHGDNMESLYKKVPQRLLPSEYGGTAGTIKELNGKYIHL
jgi:hypothetical protein